MFLSHLQHQTNRTFTKLVGVFPGSGHDSILSKVGVSIETGAVQASSGRRPGDAAIDDSRTPCFGEPGCDAVHAADGVRIDVDADLTGHPALARLAADLLDEERAQFLEKM
jgi:hypothetical protein